MAQVSWIWLAAAGIGWRSCRRQEEDERATVAPPAATAAEGFRMPLHYPRYKREDYEKMEEWRIDVLLGEYGLASDGSIDDKRAFAMGTFLWPDQL
ncbi:unnamed protein product [Spirodela intermedia]|uniref:DUF7722 domain-containing protein n=2 Tax=Spirodela intermedia TaxID=51605 RepID=A0A7I8KPC4_SPIIN|nr:unnamed protein product [Spirodela intermedia]CAA6662913.1 unnamed protein product [Spirodela intermedia]CAA7399332.1 unnamed protein product [Spirodela intermedia]